MKTGLVLEGGALRTIFSTGVCDAFLDGGLPLPDYTVGVSAGIAYGVSYLSRQSRRNLQLAAHYVNDRRYMGWRNLANPKNRSYFGLKFVYETIPNELLPFEYRRGGIPSRTPAGRGKSAFKGHLRHPPDVPHYHNKRPALS